MMSRKKIKIVHIIPTLALGGAERIMVDLAKYSDRTTYDVAVITIVHGGPHADELHRLGIPYYSLHKTTRAGLGMLIALTRLLGRLKPDIVHTHLFGGHVWGMIASIVNRVPVIVASEQNTDVDAGALRHRMKQLASYAADAVIAASDAIKRFLIDTEHVSGSKIVVVRNAIDTAPLVGLPAPRLSEVLMLIAVGRLERQKGHDVLLDALSTIKDVPWKLTIVGVGSLMEDLRHRATQLGIQDRVAFIGNSTQVAALLGAHDVLVMPSRWEGIGLAVIEGMAAGRPVIASRVGGIPELITSDDTGVLVAPEDAQALARAVRWVWEHPDAAREMGVRARAYAVAHCDVRAMVREYEQIYAHLTH